MKLIFVCSALRWDVYKNINKAQEYSRQVSLDGNIPITPHIYFTQFLDDNIKLERELWIASWIKLLELCDEMYVYWEPTEGMKMEIDFANNNNIKIYEKDCN